MMLMNNLHLTEDPLQYSLNTTYIFSSHEIDQKKKDIRIIFLNPLRNRKLPCIKRLSLNTRSASSKNLEKTS